MPRSCERDWRDGYDGLNRKDDDTHPPLGAGLMLALVRASCASGGTPSASLVATNTTVLPALHAGPLSMGIRGWAGCAGTKSTAAPSTIPRRRPGIMAVTDAMNRVELGSPAGNFTITHRTETARGQLRLCPRVRRDIHHVGQTRLCRQYRRRCVGSCRWASGHSGRVLQSATERSRRPG